MLMDIITVLGAATVVATIFHSLHFPLLVGFLFTGMIIGPHAFQLIDTQLKVDVVTELASVLLMFTIGLEFSLKKLIQFRKVLLRFGMTQVVMTVFCIFFFLIIFFHHTWNKALFFGFLFSLSSTAVALKLLNENRDVETPYGQTSLGILLFQDIAVIPMMLIIPLLSNTSLNQEYHFSLLSFLVKSLLIVSVVFTGRFVVPWVLHKVVRTRSREVFFFCILFLFVASAYFMKQLGLSLSLGAFIAGMLIAESPYGKQAMSDFEPLRDNFLGIFFVAVGMMLDLSFLTQHFFIVLFLTLIILIMKAVIIFCMCWFFGHPGKISFVVAGILFQMGEFSLVLAQLGVEKNIITFEEKQYFLAISVISLMLTPFVYQLLRKKVFSDAYLSMVPKPFANAADSLRKILLNRNAKDSMIHNDTQRLSLNGHTIIIGFGLAGQNVARVLKELTLPYVIIEMNNDTVRKFQTDEPIFFGDASRADLLKTYKLENAKIVIVAVSGVKIIQNIIHTLYEVRPDIRILLRTHFIRDMSDITLNEHSDFIIGEYETTLELIARVLKEYGVHSKQIHDLVHSTRVSIDKHTHRLEPSFRRKIDLPKWEVYANIRPLVIQQNDTSIGKSLKELEIRQLSGSLVVSLFREGLGTTYPDSDFVFESGDVVYLLGNNEQLILAEFLFRGQNL